jgi:hypothetical protein
VRGGEGRGADGPGQAVGRVSHIGGDDGANSWGAEGAGDLLIRGLGVRNGAGSTAGSWMCHRGGERSGAERSGAEVKGRWGSVSLR